MSDLYFIKRVETSPARTFKGSFNKEYHIPEKKEILYYGPACWTGFQRMLIKPKSEIQDIFAKIVTNYHATWNNSLIDPYRYGSINDVERLRDQTKFEIVKITDYPTCPEFYDIFPFDEEHIPENDRDVQFVYRDRSVCGVVTNFLRKEMLKGNFMMPNLSDYVRWQYIEDSPFLKYKKETQE